MELKECADALDIQLCKIGRILDARWVASSFRTVDAVWKAYPALYQHFTSAAESDQRDGASRQTYTGLAKRLSSHAFVNNLGLMWDALQELSELLLELQKRDINIISAHRAIYREVKVLEAMAEQAGTGRHTKLSQTAIEENNFKGVALHAGKPSDRKLSQRDFFLSLAKNMESRMLSTGGRESDRNLERAGYTKLIEELKVLHKEYWPDEPEALYGQTEVESLCTRFGIICVVPTVRAFRCFVDSKGKDVPKEMHELLVAANTIAISSAECERGFSQMNLICTATRASLHVSTIASLLFLNLVGPPLNKFNPVPYVRSWIARGHRSAIDTQSKSRNSEDSTGLGGMAVL